MTSQGVVPVWNAYCTSLEAVDRKDSPMPLTPLIRYSRLLSDFTLRVLERLVWPKVDLLTRLALAEIFLLHDALCRDTDAGAILGHSICLQTFRQRIGISNARAVQGCPQPGCA
jgi:hypothetical protein